jgi:hypothetical protein
MEKEGFIIVEETVGSWGDAMNQDYGITLEKLVNTNPLIRIETEPEGAEVYINNRFIGESPVFIHDMPEGRILRIRVKKRRYDDSTENYRITGQDEQIINILMHK